MPKKLTFIEVKKRFKKQNRKDVYLCEKGFFGWRKKSRFYDTAVNDYFWMIPEKVYYRKSVHPKRKQEKFAQTCISRYGVKNPSQNERIKNKKKLVSVKNWNVDNPVKSNVVKEKTKKTVFKRYGKEAIFSIEEIKKKIKNTNLKKYGYANPSKNTKVRNKIKNKSRIIKEKSHKTMKENGTYKSFMSKPEIILCDILYENFGRNNVVLQKFVNYWPIDFYLTDIDVYIQIDGVYWHGLDRDIKEIKKHKTRQDEMIHKKWLTDKKQNKWFYENKLRLLRFTDIDIITAHKFNDFSKIINVIKCK